MIENATKNERQKKPRTQSRVFFLAVKDLEHQLSYALLLFRLTDTNPRIAEPSSHTAGGSGTGANSVSTNYRRGTFSD